jgi:gas vesicle protein
MRYKAVFIVGFAAGFVAGARSGRETYDKIVSYGQQVAAHPKVQQATTTAQAKATELAKTAAAKAPDYAKSAATSAANAAKTAQSQVPKYVSSAKQAAQSKMPARFGGGSGNAATEGTSATRIEDDVTADGNLVYPAEGSPSVNGTIRHYTPGAPEAGS